MKRVLRNPTVSQKRKIMEKAAIPDVFFSPEKQLELVKTFLIEEAGKEEEYYSIVKQQIFNKIAGYRSQDVIKKKFNETLFIDYKTVVSELYNCGMLCCYCKCQLALLYELVREQKQWTLDRINNELGHNVGNVVVACLECNLKRRNTSKESFAFTKQLTVTRESYE
jgi:hypothetical protein